MEIEVLEGRSLGSLFHDGEWYQCHICGWWGYFGENVPDKYKLYGDDPEFRGGFLCTWCMERHDWQLNAATCTECGWSGVRAVIGSEPDDLAVCDIRPGGRTLCVPCIRRCPFVAEGQLASVKRYVIK